MNTVIINSIGTATPGASKVLSDALKVPQDYILKLLYNAPSVLFQKVDEDTAQKAEDTLTKLGLEVAVCKEDEKIDLTTELVDISVSFDDILKLPIVTEQLSIFLGCKQSEVLSLLLKEPSIVLGNVSRATAEALQKRVDTDVYFSNPRKDEYTVLVSKDKGARELKNIARLLKFEPVLQDEVYVFENISYNDSQLVWRKYQSNDFIKILNQSHQSVTIELDDFDIQNEEHTNLLINKIGMPEEILEDIHTALPIVLFEDFNRNKALDLYKECEAIGLKTSIQKDFNFKKNLQIDEIEDVEQVNKILGQFIDQENLPKEGATEWINKEEIPPLIAKYLCAQLETLNCNPEIIN